MTGPLGAHTGSARSLLVTLLGEFVMTDDGPVWTSSLLQVLTRLDVEEQTARQAVNRGAVSGWIEAERRGREARWHLTDTGRRLLRDGEQRAYALTSDQVPWDGRWLVVHVSIPKQRTTVRRQLYASLQRRGFGNPTPGVWISPYPEREQEVRMLVARFGLEDSTLSFTGPSATVGLTDADLVARSWDLRQVAQRYERLLERFGTARPRPGDPLLLTHIRLVNEWQHLPLVDPRLPEELLPDWIGRRATRTFGTLRSRWQPAARARWREIVAATEPAVRSPS